MFMKTNLFIIRNHILTTALLLTVGLMISCSRSTEIQTIVVNQSNEANKKPMTKPINTNQNIETSPLNLPNIPTVTYCELIKNSTNYDKKVVRVRGIYFTAFEKMYLYDETCETDKSPTAPEKVPAETWAEWDKSFVSKGDSEEAKLNRQLNGFGRKDVTVIGKFYATNEQNDANAPNRFGHMNCCRFQFSILRLEKIATQ